MTSPPQTIQVVCPDCGNVYEDWYRPSINLSLDNFDDEYVEQATTSTCPKCQHKVAFGALIFEAGGRWAMRTARNTQPARKAETKPAQKRTAKKGAKQ